MSSPLVVVTFVLRHQPDTEPLQQLAGNICSYLGPSPSLSLSTACYLGSLKLLDWIWDSSCTSVAQRTSNWSLTNILRSDPHYNRYQFAKSTTVAAARYDISESTYKLDKSANLEMLKWMFAHFSGGQVPEAVAACAASSGNLPMLQFLLKNDAGRRDREEGGDRKKRKVEGEIQRDNRVVVTWGPLVMERAKWGQHAVIVQWLKENVPEYKEEETSTANEIDIVHALENGKDALAKVLVPPGRCVLDYAAKCSRPNLIELMLDCGYIRRDRGCANSAIGELADSGRLDFMQQVVLLHSPPPKDGQLCRNAWSAAIDTACGHGHLAMLQWLQYRS